jgi:hypothetical protein
VVWQRKGDGAAEVIGQFIYGDASLDQWVAQDAKNAVEPFWGQDVGAAVGNRFDESFVAKCFNGATCGVADDAEDDYLTNVPMGLVTTRPSFRRASMTF